VKVPISNVNLMRATALLSALGVLILLAMVALSFWMLERTRSSTEAVLASRGERSALVDLLSVIQDAETGQRGYLLTGEPRYLEPFEAANTNIEPAFAKLLSKLPPGEHSKTFAKELKALIDAKLAESTETVNLRREGKSDEALAVVLTDRGKKVMDDIRTLIHDEIAEVEKRFSAEVENQRESAAYLRVTTVAGGLMIVLAGLGVAWAMRTYMRELLEARSEVQALNTGLEARVKERTADLQRANDEIQRFAYIVSHDLRAPLVNVMGFTSEMQTSLEALEPLTTDPAVLASPAGPAAVAAITTDVPEAISFIRASTRKMDGLINAILKLSREGQRTLNPEAVDLGALFEGIAASAQHRLTETGGELKINQPVPVITSDRLALEQIFGNLVDNALKYRSPARPPVIDVSVQNDRSGWVVINVQDNGRGIGEEDFERVFDLFRRAGVQNQPGEGIGLAHVRALVRRLGGQITLKSELGTGTAFQVILPRNLREKQEQSSERRG
jgi:signal transduction histidine kinase